jgi:hypothetical protein
VGGDKGLPRQIGTHAAIAQDEVGQHCKDSLARGTLYAPDGEAAEANPRIMGVAGEETAAAATRGFVPALAAKSKAQGQDALNERFAIDTATVRNAFARRQVITLRADWTNGDPVITEILKRHGRAGVPMYLVYPGGKKREPALLPELISAQNVLDALKQG